MKYYLVAGEASGDLHGSNLIRNLKSIDRDAVFRCFGGDLMQQAGGEVVLHYKKMSFSGIMEVVRNLATIRRTLNFCKRDILAYKPDVVILIDYPGFNLKVAEFAKKCGLKTLYYIAPKIWASRKSRIKRIRKSVDKLYVILPFEEEYFKKLGVDAEYHGNPLSDAIADFKATDPEQFRKENNLTQKPVIALLAGSRKSEIKLCLPEMIKACEEIHENELVLAGAPSIKKEFYETFIGGTRVKMVYNQTYNLLNIATAALVTSGTATLETALFKVPEVVFYKVGALTYLIGRPFFRIRFFSLVNIIMDREVVKEFLQFRLAGKIRRELDRILYDTGYRNSMLAAYEVLAGKTGTSGTSERVAQSMYQYLIR
jgi:lipid-A-disaccharide synthase